MIDEDDCMPVHQYDHLLEEMDTKQPVSGEAILYGGEIAVDGGERPDTVVLVTDQHLYAKPIAGSGPESGIDVEIALADIQEFRCEGFLSGSVSITTGDETYRIPTDGVDRVAFTNAIVERSQLTNGCEGTLLDRIGLTPCGWLTCAGCAMVLVGASLSITVVGLLVGAPLLGLGIGVLLAGYLYRQYCERKGLTVWTRREATGSASV
jgi:hypothetical protein